MTPVDQTQFRGHPDGGNCMQAAVATILGLPLSEVPHFLLARKTHSHEELAMRAFLKSLGFEALRLPKDIAPESPYLAIGYANRGGLHMVVMRDGRLVHDPHPSRSGLTSIEYIYLLVPYEPARCVKALRLEGSPQS